MAQRQTKDTNPQSPRREQRQALPDINCTSVSLGSGSPARQSLWGSLAPTQGPPVAGLGPASSPEESPQQTQVRDFLQNKRTETVKGDS